jgi:hypothetical protein
VRVDISLGYADLIRLFNVDDPRDFALGLELRDNGVFVKSREGLPAIARGGEEEAVLTEHPTGNLSEPVLAFPCSLGALQDFMDAYGLVGRIDAFRMREVLKPKDRVLALAESKAMGQYNQSIVMKLSPMLENYKRWHEAEGNDGKKVVLRKVLDDLIEALKDVDVPNVANKAVGEMDPRHRLTLLRIIRALCAMQDLRERGASTPVDTQLQKLGFLGPKEATIRNVLTDAYRLEPDEPGATKPQ